MEAETTGGKGSGSWTAAVKTSLACATPWPSRSSRALACWTLLLIALVDLLIALLDCCNALVTFWVTPKT